MKSRRGLAAATDSPCSPDLQSFDTVSAESLSDLRVDFFLATECGGVGAAVYAIFLLAYICGLFLRERDKTVKPIPG